MPSKVLFVDDDQNVLDAIRRKLRKRFDIETARGPREAVGLLSSKGPFSVVVSDLRMPELDGVSFLDSLRKRCPETVRVMLTGYADIDAAMAAVNKGQVFRFLTKPCPDEILVGAVEDAIRQHQLVTAEKELLRGTLRGCIKVLTELLALVNPEAFGRSARIKRHVLDTARYMEIPDLWRVELAAMLSQIGCAMLPEEALQAVYRGERLSAEHAQIFEMHPTLTRDLLASIPRLEEVTAMIAYQEKRWDGGGAPADGVKGLSIPLGARVLKVALDHDALTAGGRSVNDALAEMRSRSGWYDPTVLAAFEAVVNLPDELRRAHLMIQQLRPGMILDEDVRTLKGFLLFVRGYEVNRALIEHLKLKSGEEVIKQPIRVLIPKNLPEEGIEPEPGRGEAMEAPEIIEHFEDSEGGGNLTVEPIYAARPEMTEPAKPMLDGASLAHARECFQEFNALLKQERVPEALESVVRGLDIYLAATLFPNEKAELARIVEKIAYRLNLFRPFKALFPEGVEYAPGDESRLRADLADKAGRIEGRSREIDEKKSAEARAEAMTHIDRAKSFLARGEIAKAKSVFSRLAPAECSDASLLSMIGRALAEAGEQDAASEHLERAARIEPPDAETALQLGRLQLAMRRHRDARATAASAVERLGESAPLLLLLGQIAVAERDWDQALPALEKAAALDAGSKEVADALAYVRKKVFV